MDAVADLIMIAIVGVAAYVMVWFFAVGIHG